MQAILLLASVAAISIGGFFLMKRLDSFLNRNQEIVTNDSQPDDNG